MNTDTDGQLHDHQPPVEVIRSRRRKKTVSARLVEGVVVVRVPATMNDDDVEEHVSTLSAKLLRQNSASRIDLGTRAVSLAERHHLPAPDSIRWVHNQNDRWGSCSPTDRSIRISAHLAELPGWVLDYVIVHELAHLVEHGHGARFDELEQRFDRHERARGYLEGYEAGRHTWRRRQP